MARVSDFRIREYVEGLNLTSTELVELLEIEPRELMSKFPSKLRSSLDKLGFNDMEEQSDAVCELVPSLDEY